MKWALITILLYVLVFVVYYTARPIVSIDGIILTMLFIGLGIVASLSVVCFIDKPKLEGKLRSGLCYGLPLPPAAFVGGYLGYLSITSIQYLCNG